MLLVAFDLWSSSGNLRFRDLLGAMDNRRAAEVFSLVIALNGGGQAVDQWLAERDQQVVGNEWGGSYSLSEIVGFLVDTGLHELGRTGETPRLMQRRQRRMKTWELKQEIARLRDEIAGLKRS